MLNVLTNSDFWVYLLLPVFLWTNMLILLYRLSLSVFYLLSQLKNQGLSINVLNILFHALIVSRIVYALSAFSGFLFEYNRSSINGVFRKGRKRRITDLSFNIEELIEFQTIICLIKCVTVFTACHLCCLLLTLLNYMFNLRPRGYDLSLLFVKKVLFKNSFIIRVIFKYK